MAAAGDSECGMGGGKFKARNAKGIFQTSNCLMGESI